MSRSPRSLKGFLEVAGMSALLALLPAVLLRDIDGATFRLRGGRL